MGNMAVDFGWSNAEIGWKMANGRLLFLALKLIGYNDMKIEVELGLQLYSQKRSTLVSLFYMLYYNQFTSTGL